MFKKSFNLYIIHKLKKALENDKELKLTNSCYNAYGISGEFVLDEPEDEGGDKGAVYVFELRKKKEDVA